MRVLLYSQALTGKETPKTVQETHDFTLIITKLVASVQHTKRRSVKYTRMLCRY